MSINFTDNQELEKALIQKIIHLALIITVLYILADVFILKKNSVIQTSFPVFCLFALCSLLYKFSEYLVWNKHIVSVTFLFCNISGFLCLDGFKGVAGLDMCCTTMVFVIIFSGKERLLYLVLMSLLICFCTYIQFAHPEYILDAFASNYFLLDVFEIITRIVLVGVLICIFRQKYDNERQLTSSYNLELHEKNKEITRLNFQLEALLTQKTENIYDLHAKIDYYAFLNSHQVRGPLASVLGLTYLMKHDLCMRTIIERHDLLEYLQKLESATLELDLILREANIILAKE